MMKVARSFPTQHDDLVHDVAYDFYGKRMATCSSDQTIKVWDEDAQGEWTLTAEWKAHTGSIWKVCWAHPEFGQVIASASFDRTVVVWEEAAANPNDAPGNKATASGGAKQWVQRANLVDARNCVKDIAFAPRHLGLKLATCSTDGFIRIYEAMDVMNLTHWSLMEEFEGRKGGCNCISWNLSRFHPAMLAVGSDDGSVKLWEYHDAYRRWVVVESLSGHLDAIHDLAFAPNVGRSHHLLATASKDQTLRLWKVIPAAGSTSGTGAKPEVHLVATFEDHHAQVWRVEWNVTGTMLASSGDDGTVRLWKANYLDNWKPVSIIHGSGSAGSNGQA